MQVVMKDVNANIAWSEHAEQGVHIRAIAINQAAGFVNDADYFLNVFVKETKRVGIGKHQAGQAVVDQ